MYSERNHGSNPPHGSKPSRQGLSHGTKNKKHTSLRRSEESYSSSRSPSPLQRNYQDKHSDNFEGLQVTTTNENISSRNNKSGRSQTIPGPDISLGCFSDQFAGPEGETISKKELRKFQIDITRSIPEHLASNEPIERRIIDIKTVVIPRRKGEGSKPICKRPEFQQRIKERVPDVRKVIKLAEPNVVFVDREMRPRARASSVTRSPLHTGSMAADRHGRSRSPIATRLSFSSRAEYGLRNNKGGIHGRLGKISADVELDRDELEQLRPGTKPWDVDPEVVPTGQRYFLHDHRENDYSRRTNPFNGDRRRNEREDRFSRGGRRGSLYTRPARTSAHNFSGQNGRSLYSDNQQNNKGYRQSRIRGSNESTWKHDKFETVTALPSNDVSME